MGMIVGVVLGIIFCWPVALIAIGLCPLLMMSAMINAKVQKGGNVKPGQETPQEKQFKESNVLISDTCLNYITVGSFGYQDRIVTKYEDKLKLSVQLGIKRAHINGITFGMAQFITFLCYCVLFWSAAAILTKTKIIDVANGGISVFRCIFCIMFGAFAAGNAQQFGPSAVKGLEAAKRIFSIIDEPSKIDVRNKSDELIIANPLTMKGEIEF